MSSASLLLLRSAVPRAVAARRGLGRASSAISRSSRNLLRSQSSVIVTRSLIPRQFSTLLRPEDLQGTTSTTDQANHDKTKASDTDTQADSMGPVVHFKLTPQKHPLAVTKLDPNEKIWESPGHHSVWSKEEVNAIKITHLHPRDWPTTTAYYIAQTMRFAFDVLAGFKFVKPSENMYLNRIIFLETVAGIPGMVAGMVRHLHSLRMMKRDNGWIHTLLEEAENERMHLMTFLHLKQPGPFFRTAVLLVQGVFFNVFFAAYLINPKICHSLVGYIEEEAVKTYTHIIEEVDAGDLPLFQFVTPPPIAISYWKLAPDATFRDLLLAVRADEANHREVNHTFAGMKEDDYNPFVEHEKYLADVQEVEKKQKKHKQKDPKGYQRL